MKMNVFEQALELTLKMDGIFADLLATGFSK